MGPTVVVADEQADVAVDVERWARLAGDVLRELGAHGELTLTFVDVAEITELNAEHMGVDAPTDVLSFPLDDEFGADADRTDEVDAGASTTSAAPPVLLGDVVICPAVAAEHAPMHAGTVDDELALLVVHGILHVVGHDHAEPDEATAMRSLELDLLERWHWGGPPPAGFSQLHRD